MLSNSWIITKRDSDEVVMETWNKESIKHLKANFQAIPTHEYLYNLNRNIKNESLGGK